MPRPALLMFFALAACTPIDLWHRTGASVQKLQTDEAACTRAAFAAAPVREQATRLPPVFVPPRQYCYPNNQGGTSCKVDGGYWEPGRVVVRDMNRDRRVAEVNACMTARGYERVRLPRCGGEVTTAPRTQPPLRSESCAVKINGGRWTIH